MRTNRTLTAIGLVGLAGGLVTGVGIARAASDTPSTTAPSVTSPGYGPGWMAGEEQGRSLDGLRLAGCPGLGGTFAGGAARGSGMGSRMGGWMHGAGW